MKPLSRSSGVSHAGLQVSSPTRKYRLEESSLDVGFVLWKSFPGQEGREGEARVRPSESPAPPRISALVNEMAWDSPQIPTSPHSSILRP